MKKIIRAIIIAIMIVCSLCSVYGCGSNPATQTMTRAELASLYKGVAKNLWQALDKNDPTSTKTSPQAMQFPNHTHEELGESMLQSYKHNLAINGLFVNFVGELYENEDFTITDKVVSFGVASSTEDISYDVNMAICPTIDKEAGKVFLELMIASPDGNNKTFFIFDIGYDFENKIATSYRMIYYEPGAVFNDQILTDDGKMFIATSQEQELYQASLDEFVADFEARKENGIKLTARFDAEFQRITELASKL